ncbi:hypothetical protein K457DRAFT_129481 [Linnemannia elongata AG-77]|uniref:Uncharacterized protein n=1 Tax=Linnemannia elongata AG-77 TaxID=1314771 RepID=A0A197JI87_9FUNG|nr:hypothetical protein K457DRAFT_129481 [Linnemannia elongata AG-77]
MTAKKGSLDFQHKSRSTPESEPTWTGGKKESIAITGVEEKGSTQECTKLDEEGGDGVVVVFNVGPHVVISGIFRFYFCILVTVINGGSRSFTPWVFSIAVGVMVFYNDISVEGFTMFNPKVF